MTAENDTDGEGVPFSDDQDQNRGPIRRSNGWGLYCEWEVGERHAEAEIEPEGGLSADEEPGVGLYVRTDGPDLYINLSDEKATELANALLRERDLARRLARDE